jgi:phosphohistidine phosphatase
MDLMLLRHAKSDWDAGAHDDHSRPLSTRGVRSAERMGEVLRDLDLVPDIVVSSTATRARSTAELARISGGWSSRLVLEDALYGASVGESLEVAAAHGGVHQRLMLVGHEPTWSMLVRHLTGANAEIRTATCAVMEMHTDEWADAPRSSGALVTLLQPRNFLSS